MYYVTGWNTVATSQHGGFTGFQQQQQTPNNKSTWNSNNFQQQKDWTPSVSKTTATTYQSPYQPQVSHHVLL